MSGRTTAARHTPVLTGFACAGPFGLADTVPADPTTPHPPVVVSGVRVRLPHPDLLQAVPAGLSPRQQRYLGRAARLALSASRAALERAGFPAANSEDLACLVATSRGPEDRETTLEMIRAARAASSDGRLSAAAALECYRRRRSAVQYLLSMETAVAGHLTAAFGARGPTHVVTTPGLAGGTQALLRGLRLVARGDARATLVCAVLTAENPEFVTESMRLLSWDTASEVIEGACALMLETRQSARERGVQGAVEIRGVDEGFQPARRAERTAAGEVGEPGDGGPYAGAVLPLWILANRCADGDAGRLRFRGGLGHRYAFEWSPLGEVP